VFHAGDGNLHPLILYDANQPGQLDTAVAMGEQILALCVAAGGTVTGEHGVGVEKLDAMCGQFDAPALAQFHRLKAAFDPRGLLNPGKAIPTLARCAELGGMHVHGGALPFPEIERL
jgi:glycolate oxidase